jgi:hypothetical protein
MGAKRLVTLLSWVLALFGPTVMVDYWEGGLGTTLRPGLQCWGLGAQFGWGPGPRDKSEIGSSYLCLGYKRGVCFSGFLARLH